MSGLALQLRRDGSPADHGDVCAVQDMLAAAPYRGPDGHGIAADGPLVAGCARMVVTPEDAHDRQPLVDGGSGVVLVADARLDNRPELLAGLAVPAEDGARLSDAALILRAYQAWGTETPAHLLGDFAFAVWDPRCRRLLCARDPMGQRSLFYRLTGTLLVAASEIVQLLQDPGVPVEPDDAHIQELLVPANMWVNEKARATTYFRGISAVPPGHTLVVEDGRVATRAYWCPRAVPTRRYARPDDVVEDFRSVFFEAVRARLRSIHPMGVMVSGGIDSTSVACAAAELFRRGTPDPGFAGYSVSFPGLECDEQALVQDVATKHGFGVHFVPAPITQPILMDSADLLDPPSFMAQPVARHWPLGEVFRAAAASGARVLLTGEVADSCVRGSPLVFDSLLRKGKLPELRRALGHYRRTSDDSWAKIAGLYLLFPLLPLWLQRQLMAAHTHRSFRKQRARLVPRWIPEPLREQLASRHIELELAAERSRTYANPAREAEFRMLHPPEVGLAPEGISLEIWRPYADVRLHELLLSVPPELKFSPHPDTDDWYAASKLLTRRAMQGLLPESIRARTTPTHFASAFEAQLERDWPSYVSAFGPGSRSEVTRRGYVDEERFWTRLQQVRAGARGKDLMYVLRMVSLETWLRSLSAPRTPGDASLKAPLRHGAETALPPGRAAGPISTIS